MTNVELQELLEKNQDHRILVNGTENFIVDVRDFDDDKWINFIVVGP